jgi:hypothetical protein
VLIESRDDMRIGKACWHIEREPRAGKRIPRRVTNGAFCQALSVMQSYLRRPKGLAHYVWRRDNIVSHDLKAKVGALERSTRH